MHIPDAPDRDPHTEYGLRLRQRREAVARLERKHRQIGNLRLALFTSAALLGWLAFISRVCTPWWMALPLGTFVILVIVHERVLQARRKMGRAVGYYERGLARLEDRWIGSGEPGDRFLDPGHPYAPDLDLFGRGSLFELLCTARTRMGEETLASWLKSPASPAEIRSRQASISELLTRLDLREDLAVLGVEVRSGVDPDALLAWSSVPPVALLNTERIGATALAACTVATLAVSLALDAARTWFLVFALLELCLALWMRTRINRVVESVERPGRDLTLLSQVLARLEDESFTTPRLVDLRKALECEDRPPSLQIARLNRLIRLLDARRNLLFSPIAAVLLWHIQLAFAIEAWRRKSGVQIPRWLDAVGEIETLCALSGYAYEHPADPFPDIEDRGFCFDGEGLGHPLLLEGRCVRNDVRLGEGTRVLLVSGSNMSGKSTLLRTVGTNAVLALAGAPVRAKRLRISPLALGASIRILDSLQAGSSRFYAEITRLRQLVEITSGRLTLLFLLDELLHGTNSHDRRIGAEAVVKGLVERGAIGLLTTHDLALAHIVDVLAPRAANVHFEDHIEDGKIAFDYCLRPGVVERSNALELMRSIGLEV